MEDVVAALDTERSESRVVCWCTSTVGLPLFIDLVPVPCASSGSSSGRRAAGIWLALRLPLLVGALDFVTQPAGVLLADAVRILLELGDDLFDRLALRRQVPDAGLEQLAALAVRRAVPDHVVVVDRGRLLPGVVEVVLGARSVASLCASYRCALLPA